MAQHIYLNTPDVTHACIIASRRHCRHAAATPYRYRRRLSSENLIRHLRRRLYLIYERRIEGRRSH